MKEQKTTPKFKHIREKNYDSSHPLYDAMKTICNPEGENSGHTADYKYEDGHLSWIFRRDYNERSELIHMEDAFYGDNFTHEFQDTPHYTLISNLTYEYDEYRNWTLCYLQCVDGLQPDELTIRDIEYW